MLRDHARRLDVEEMASDDGLGGDSSRELSTRMVQFAPSILTYRQELFAEVRAKCDFEFERGLKDRECKGISGATGVAREPSHDGVGRKPLRTKRR